MAINQSKQIEFLKKYYELDEARKTFDVVLHYKKASELFDEQIETIANPIMKEEVLEKITNILKDIPHGYKADISLVIDDFEGYDKGVILSSFNDLLEIGKYRFSDESRNKWLKFALLILVGILIIFSLNLAKSFNWWNIFAEDELTGTVFGEVLNITSWVFVWEAVSIVFLRPSDIALTGSLILSRISTFSLYNSDSDLAIAKETKDQITKHIFEKNTLERAGSLLLLFSGFAIIGLAFANILTSITQYDQYGAYVVTGVIFSVLYCINKLVTGVLAILLYKGKDRFRTPTLVVTIFDLLYILITIVSLFVGKFSVSALVSIILALTIHSAYVLGFIFYCISHPRKKVE